MLNRKKLLAICLMLGIFTHGCASKNDEYATYGSQSGYYETEDRPTSEFTTTYVVPIMLGVAAVAGVGLFVWGLGNLPVSH